MRWIYWIALVVASLTPIGAFAQCVQAPPANTWKTLLPTTTGCGKLAKPYRYLQAQKSDYKIGINGVCTSVMFKNESTNVQCLNGQPTLIGWKSSEERLSPYTRDDFDRMKTVEVANSYVKKSTGESVLTQTRETTRENKYKLNPMGDYDLSIPGNPFITTTIKTIDFKGAQKIYTLKINDKVTRACSVTTAPDGKKSFMEMTPKDCQNEGLQSFWGTISEPAKLPPVEGFLTSNSPSYDGKLRSVSIPAGSIKEMIKRRVLKPASGELRLVTSKELGFSDPTSPSDNPPPTLAPPPVCKDPDSNVFNEEESFEFPTNELFDCSTDTTIIEQSSYDCGGVQQTRMDRKVTLNLVPLFDVLNDGEIEMEWDEYQTAGVSEAGAVDNGPQTFDEFVDLLQSTCVLRTFTEENFSYQCVNSVGKTVSQALMPAARSKVTSYYDLNTRTGTSRRGQPMRVEFKVDRAEWDVPSGSLTSREYLSSSHAITVRPEGDPNIEACNEYKVEPAKANSIVRKRYMRAPEVCDRSRTDDNSRCFSKDPAIRQQTDCHVLSPARSWTYQVGGESSAGYSYSKNFGLFVKDFYTNCRYQKRFWFGDNPAIDGYINGQPVYLRTGEWFHTKSYGTFLWEDPILDPNWNSSYILGGSDLPRWDQQ